MGEYHYRSIACWFFRLFPLIRIHEEGLSNLSFFRTYVARITFLVGAAFFSHAFIIVHNDYWQSKSSGVCKQVTAVWLLAELSKQSLQARDSRHAISSRLSIGCIVFSQSLLGTNGPAGALVSTWGDSTLQRDIIHFSYFSTKTYIVGTH